MPEIYGPRQVVLVTCRYKGKDNIITIAWHSPLSFKPEMYGIVVGKNRYSYKMIKNSGVFCINFISENMKKQAIECGTESGKSTDKFEKFKIEKEECKKINCPRIKNSLGFLECKVVKEIETGDHVIFIGNVLKSEIKGDGKRIFHITGNRFTTTTD